MLLQAVRELVSESSCWFILIAVVTVDVDDVDQVIGASDFVMSFLSCIIAGN